MPRKIEESVHMQVCNYLRLQYPAVLFRTDFAAGFRMTIGQAAKHKRMQAVRAWPDLFLAEPKGKYHGLFIELKRPGTRVWLKNGNLTSNIHIQEQEAVLAGLEDKGYAATFAIGFDQAKKVIDMYLRGGLLPARSQLEAAGKSHHALHDDGLAF